MQKIALLIAMSVCLNYAESFKEKDKGVFSLAFSGGGTAEIGGISAIFSNPASLKIPTGQQFFLGVAPTQGISPSLYYGGNKNMLISYAIGAFRDNPSNYLHHGILGGFTISPGPYFSIGLVVYSQNIEVDSIRGFNSDFNAGVVYRLFSWLQTGFAVKNINESNIVDGSKLLKIQRSYHSGIKLLLHERFQAYYDLYSLDILKEPASHIAALKTNIGAGNNLGIIGSIRGGAISSDPNFSMGLGINLDTRVGLHLWGFCYSLAGIPVSNYSDEILQSFSVYLNLGVFEDKTPPLVSAKEDKGVLIPSEGGDHQYVYFRLLARDEDSDLESWQFVICESDAIRKPGKPVKAFTGKGLPPKIIKWDGRDSYMALLAPGFYYYRLIAKDKASNIASTKWQLIEIKE